MTELYGITISFGGYKPHRFVFKFEPYTEHGYLTIYDICLDDFDSTQEYSFRGKVFGFDSNQGPDLSTIVEIPRLQAMYISQKTFIDKPPESSVQLKVLSPLNPLIESAFTITFEQI